MLTQNQRQPSASRKTLTPHSSHSCFVIFWLCFIFTIAYCVLHACVNIMFKLYAIALRIHTNPTRESGARLAFAHLMQEWFDAEVPLLSRAGCLARSQTRHSFNLSRAWCSLRVAYAQLTQKNYKLTFRIHGDSSQGFPKGSSGRPIKSR